MTFLSVYLTAILNPRPFCHSERLPLFIILYCCPYCHSERLPILSFWTPFSGWRISSFDSSASSEWHFYPYILPPFWTPAHFVILNPLFWGEESHHWILRQAQNDIFIRIPCRHSEPQPILSFWAPAHIVILSACTYCHSEPPFLGWRISSFDSSASSEWQIWPYQIQNDKFDHTKLRMTNLTTPNSEWRIWHDITFLFVQKSLPVGKAFS